MYFLLFKNFTLLGLRHGPSQGFLHHARKHAIKRATSERVYIGTGNAPAFITFMLLHVLLTQFLCIYETPQNKEENMPV